MTDITTTAPIAIRHLRLPKLGLPNLGLGPVFASILATYSRAIEMAYVAPFKNLNNRQVVASDEDLEGRDPSW